MANGILVFGLNGSGKSTLGKKLAQMLDYKFMDIEDYYFEDSIVPYSKMRTREECTKLMVSDIKKHDNFVLSAVTGDFGNEVISAISLGVYMYAPLDLRLKRIKQRSIDKFGERVNFGGDMYDSEESFFKMVHERNSDKVEKWLESVSLPIIEIDGIKGVDENLDYIKQIIKVTYKSIE